MKPTARSTHYLTAPQNGAGPITSIRLVSDPLMTAGAEQWSNLRWMRDILTRPLAEATGLPVSTLSSGDGDGDGDGGEAGEGKAPAGSPAPAFSRARFFEKAGIALEFATRSMEDQTENNANL